MAERAPVTSPARHCLAVRLDNAGDVLLAGPAVRAIAAACDRVTMLAGPRGAAAARLLPGVDEVMVWRAPWVDLDPPPVRPGTMTRLVAHLTEPGFTEAVIFTSFHQSPLPTALVLRLAGIPRIAAISEDYPGSLLDVRHRGDADIPEAQRALGLARAAGYQPAPGDDGKLAVRRPLPDVSALTGPGPYVVLHPGASAPARCWPRGRWREAAGLAAARGQHTILTGGPAERDLTAAASHGIRGRHVTDLGGRTSLAELAAVLAGASAVLVANTGAAHLAAAVGTPVVSLFAPVVPAARWAPYGVPVRCSATSTRPAGTAGRCTARCPATRACPGSARKRPAMRWTSCGPGRPHEAADLARARIVDHGVRPGPAHLPAAAGARPRPRRPGPGPDLGLARVRGRGAGRAAPRRADRRGDPAAAQRGSAHPPAHRPPSRPRPARDLPGARRPQRERAAHPAPDGRPGRPAPGACHPLQRAVLGLRRHRGHRDRARHRGPRDRVDR